MGPKNLGSVKGANRLGVLYFASLTQRSNCCAVLRLQPNSVLQFLITHLSYPIASPFNAFQSQINHIV